MNKVIDDFSIGMFLWQIFVLALGIVIAYAIYRLFKKYVFTK